MNTSASVSSDQHKHELRLAARAARKNLTAPVRESQMQATSAHIAEWLRSHAEFKAFTAVLPYGSEPPLLPFLHEMHAEGFRILVPVTEPDRRMSFVEWTPGVAMERSPVAPIDEPVGERLDFTEMSRVDVMLIPAQLIDTSGGRMGQGGGYYDRFLEKVRTLPTPPKLYAVVFEHELVTPGTFPVEAFDQRVDGVFTSAGLTRFDR